MKDFISKYASYLVAVTVISTSSFAASIPLPPDRPFHLAQNKGGGDSNSSADGSASSAVGGLTLEDRSYLRDYNSKRKYPSIKYEDDVSIGRVLPETGSYYSIEGRESLNGYKYTIINDKTVIIDPNTRRIIEIID
jgi:Protein of unknown function (DUF1236)